VANGPGRIAVEIVDDGDGGAHLAKGHGLAGLDDRVRAAGGTLGVVSPVGGPTTIAVELAC
ncbi:histidine kinase, partial [Mycobacterium sp. ITM-2017-0098]